MPGESVLEANSWAVGARNLLEDMFYLRFVYVMGFFLGKAFSKIQKITLQKGHTSRLNKTKSIFLLIVQFLCKVELLLV